MKKSDKSTFQKVMERSAVIFGLASAALFAAYRFAPLDIFEILAITSFTFFYHIAMRLAVGAVVPAVMRKSRPDPNGWWFGQREFEKKLYKTLGVREWKDKMPTYNPDSFSIEKNTLEDIVFNTCSSELVHEVIMLLSFVPLLFTIVWGTFAVFLITSLLAAAVDCSFVMMQRYNRPRLLRLLERQKRSAEIE